MEFVIDKIVVREERNNVAIGYLFFSPDQSFCQELHEIEARTYKDLTTVTVVSLSHHS